MSADGKTYTSAFDAAGKTIKYVAQPSISRLENTSKGVHLIWNAVPGAAKYKVVVKTATSGWKTVGYTSGNHITWTGAESGVSYTFGICCVTSDGKTATSSFDATGKTIRFIARPTIAAVQNTAEGIKITWKAVPGAAKYKLVVKTPGSSWKTIWNTVGTSYTWTGAESGKTYTFGICCTTADGKRYTSAFDSIGKTIKYIAEPGFSSLKSTASGVKLTWKKVPGAVMYKIVVKTATSGWKTVGYTAGNNFTWAGATEGVTYTFGIRCVSVDGKTDMSSFNTTGWTHTFNP